MRRTILTLLVLSVMGLALSAQTGEISISRGPVLKIYPDFPESSGSVWAAASYFPKIKDSTLWNRAYKFPVTGIKFSYAELGNKVLGKALGLQYIFLKQKKLMKNLDFLWGIGLGVTYFTKPYHYISNQENIASGGHLAVLAELDLGLSLHFNRHFSLIAFFNQYHTSNGHTQLPNVGINTPAYRLGLQYHWNERPKELQEIRKDEWKAKWQLNGRFSLGMNEFGRSTAPTNGPKHFIYLTSLYMSKRYSAKGYFQAGIDGYYNSGYRSYLVTQQPAELEDKFTNASVFLVFIGHEYVYGHYGLVVQGGYYLHNPFLKFYLEKDKTANSNSLKAKVPGKFGVNYYLKSPYDQCKQNLYIGLYVKSNVSQADFLEAGIGWRL